MIIIFTVIYTITTPSSCLTVATISKSFHSLSVPLDQSHYCPLHSCRKTEGIDVDQSMWPAQEELGEHWRYVYMCGGTQ